jgi:LmbE family N-acetylglucosaminyl deacetylase
MARLYVSAHQDDDLIFMSPCLVEDVASRADVWTVYVTAGDAGFGEDYWRGREEGERAAYSAMGASGWREETLRLSGRKITSSVSANGRVTLIFLRLPDGGRLSREEASSKALERMWVGEEVGTVDGSTRYTREGLITALNDIIRLTCAHIVSTHDPDGWIAGCDHIDHFYTGLFAREAARRADVPQMLFRGYSCDLSPPNLPDLTYHRKRAIFEAYARHDSMIPSPLDALYEGWLKRSINRLVPST